jgi:8-oxo-dGTP diphosphatase
MPTYRYARPSVTVDAVVFGAERTQLKLLLVERKEEPFRGSWALPGGYVRIRESLEDAVVRELREETAVTGVPYMEQLYTFGDPKRDPRGRVISVAYFCLVRPNQHAVRAGSDAARASWHPVDGLPALAFDHAEIVGVALRRLQAKVRYAPLGFELLPKTFTLPELQALYEVVLQRKLDKRNFRKRILATGVLEDTGEQSRESNPPARLYRFAVGKYRALEKQGFNFEI